MKLLQIIFILMLSCFAKGNNDFSELCNRRIYSFNYGIEKILFFPVTSVYSNVLPSVVKNKSTNFFKYINDFQKSSNFIFMSNKINNNVIFSRLLINTFFGMFGTFDLACFYNFNYEEIKFKNIFCNDNYNNSFYLFFPILGPTTFKDIIYLLFAQLFTPCFYYFKRLSLYYFFEIINIKSEIFLDMIFVDKNMIDPYSYVKDAYFQNNLRSNMVDDFLLF